MKKRMLSMLLMLCMVVSLLPGTAFAAEGDTAEPPDQQQCAQFPGCGEEVHDVDCPLYTVPEGDEENVQSTSTLPNRVDALDDTSGEYSVSSANELKKVIETIGNSSAKEATIILTADIENTDTLFAGIQGVVVTLQSTEGAKHSIKLAKSFNGPVTLGSIIGDWGTGFKSSSPNRVFANGYDFVTTEDFAVRESNFLILFGGSESSDVTGSTNLNLSGGKFYTVVGGGYESNVSGGTNVIIDGAEVGGIIGGGMGSSTGKGCVGGDANVTIRSGKLNPLSSSSVATYYRYIYGGGYNSTKTYSDSIATVSGDTYLTFGGEADGVIEFSPTYSAYTYFAGAYFACIQGGTHLTLLKGSKLSNTSSLYPKLYGGGEGDHIDGTVEITISGGDNMEWEDVSEFKKGGEKGIDLFVGGFADSQILNNNSEPYAVILTMTGGSLANIYGTCDEKVYSGDQYTGIHGDVKMDISGNVEIGIVEGSYRRRVEDANPTSRTYVTVTGSETDPVIRSFSGCESLTFNNMGSENSPTVVYRVGYTNLFEIKDSWLNIGKTYWDSNATSVSECMPWVKDLTLTNTTLRTEPKAITTISDAEVSQRGTYSKGEGGKVTIKDSTWLTGNIIDIYGDMELNNGTLVLAANWIQAINPSLNSVHGNFSSNGGKIYINAVVAGLDNGNHIPNKGYYSNENNNGPLRFQVGGTASGSCDVYIAEKGKYPTLQTPAVGDNYIVAVNGDLSSFRLANLDAVERGLAFKQINGQYYLRSGQTGTYENGKIWQVAKGITVIFDKNGGDTEANPKAITVECIAGQTEYTPGIPPTPPIRAGYEFTGWNTKANGTGDAYGADTKIGHSMTVYAQWKEIIAKYTVTYDLNGGDANGKDYSPVTVDSGEKVTVKDAPTKSGHTFTGWSGSDGKDYHPGDVLTVTGNITLTAQWRKTGGGGESTTYYILHYESNGGTKYKDERYVKNTVVQLDKVPVREGYQFTGWYADKELTERITSIKMTSDKTVYAGWRKATVPDMLNGDDHFAYVIGYTDGTVRPNANISRSEVAAIFFRLLKPEVRDGNLTSFNTFTDVNEGMWCNKSISTMAALNIVKGRSAEYFDPDAPITRAEFAAICARFDTGMTEGDSNFTDISGHWAEAEIERATSLGWIMGYTDGTFRPDNYITRAEAMTMINRVLCRIPEDEDDLLPGMNVWPDNQPGAWYYLAVQEATNSHDFRYKGEIYEHWIILTADPDWTRYQ